MNEFAQILGELIEQGKSKRVFNIQKLAKEAGITPSYLSNLKHKDYNPPAHKTLVKVIDALRRFGVVEADIQRLLAAYNRTQLGIQPEGNLLAALVELYHKEHGFLGRLQQHFPVVPEPERSECPGDFGAIRAGIFEGNMEALHKQHHHLLQMLMRHRPRGGKIFITWTHCLEEVDLQPTPDSILWQLLDALRTFLWAGSPFSLHLLSSCEVTTSLTMLQGFLAQFIGTSNCALYEIASTAYLPGYVVVEGVGFIEAKPKGEDRYWIRTVLLGEDDNGESDELTATIEYLEYLIASHNAQPLIQTGASLEMFTVTAGLKRLVETELRNVTTKRAVIKSTFSTIYISEETLRARLRILPLSQNTISSYVEYHRQRREALYKRLEFGQELAIHPKGLFKQNSLACLKRAFADTSDTLTVCKTEAIMLQEQILQVLEILNIHTNFHFALAEQEWPIRFILAGDMVFFGFDLPQAPTGLYAERKQLEAIAWTRHPSVIQLLKREFAARWEQVDKQWRTDTEEGKRHVIHFMISESVTAFVKANMPIQRLGTFLCSLIERSPFLDLESFIREVYLQEQAAREIVIFSSSLPLITMPDDSGPWPPKSSVRTLQRLFRSVLHGIDSFRIITMQQGLEQYWRTNQYRGQRFERSWTVRHFQAVHSLLREASENLSVELSPSFERFPLEIEIIDREFVCIESFADGEDGRGLLLREPSLAEEFLQYFERNASGDRSSHLSGKNSVTAWFAERVGISESLPSMPS